MRSQGNADPKLVVLCLQNVAEEPFEFELNALTG